MRITSIDLSVGTDLGLQPSVMKPLGGLVVLAGPNGAGKSRILTLVKQILTNHLVCNHDANAIRHILASMRQTASFYPVSSFQPYEIAEKLLKAVTMDSTPTSGCVHEFTPRSFDLRDHRELSDTAKDRSARSIESVGLEGFDGGTLPYINRVLSRWFVSSHQHFRGTKEAAEDAMQSKEQLTSLVNAILGATLDLDINQCPTLFGFPVPEARLSTGQCALLQLAVALYAQRAKLDGLVLLLDEPECHLHPAATIELIGRRRDANSTGQIWLATHCVPLLAAMPPESIWFVKDGGASWAGRKPEIVLEGLLGGPQGRENMEEFLRLPAQLAATRFAAECLLPPKVLDTEADDPQAAQLREFCQSTSACAAKPLRVLDFGAGKGRLLHALEERWDGPDPFNVSIDYRAYDPMSDDDAKAALERHLLAVYPDASIPRRFHDSVSLAVRLDESFDVVVLCNVLHEIEHDKWPSLFGPAGLITKLCKPNGVVLVLEDMEIPHGEKAHRFGFLLLDEPHLYALLRLTEKDRQISTVQVRNGRLLAHAIPAASLGRATSESTRVALEKLKETARQKVTELRMKEPGSRNGRLYALWTQLLANAELALNPG
jgi:ABC-type cobalamin/Fe3+-siderophores transport system ATPase subunit/SAM-dependent methyltransferase